MDPGRPRALIVEDDRSWQQILTEILTDAGLGVDVVDSLRAAIGCLRATPHRLAVVDLSLVSSDYHNQDGLRVLEAVRRHDPDCVTIMLTGFATVELAVSALSQYGAFTCLRKESFRRAEFRQLVREALASAPPLEASQHGTEDAAAEGSTRRTAESATGVGIPPELALIVEDDAGWRGILSELLADAGYEVRACNSYGEALGHLRRERYALAVIDLSLEGVIPSWKTTAEASLDGYRLLDTTGEAGTPTIVVSGVATAQDIERAYAERGVFACLEKQTFDRRSFLRTVEEARAAAQSGRELEGLTPREREVLELLVQGLTNKEIAEALVITTNTVKRHLKSIFVKLDVHTRSAAAAKAVSAGVPAERL